MTGFTSNAVFLRDMRRNDKIARAIFRNWHSALGIWDVKRMAIQAGIRCYGTSNSQLLGDLACLRAKQSFRSISVRVILFPFRKLVLFHGGVGPNNFRIMARTASTSVGANKRGAVVYQIFRQVTGLSHGNAHLRGKQDYSGYECKQLQFFMRPVLKVLSQLLCLYL